MTQRFVSSAGSQLDTLNQQLARTNTIDQSNRNSSFSIDTSNPQELRRVRRRLSRSSVNVSFQKDPFIEDEAVNVKLGTVQGALIPTVLNTLSIIMFLRFGFILSETGILGMFLLLLIGYLIDFTTALSLSAIATNGTVKGGGAYYLSSRTLGPEFGGSVGVIFTLGQIANVALNVVGLVESVVKNFGSRHGVVAHVFPEGAWWAFLYSTVVLIACTLVCLFGSKLFTRATLTLAAILGISTLSIFVTAFVRQPFRDPDTGAEFTGISWSTFEENLWPNFTQSPAKGSTRPEQVTNFESVFAVLFPALVGILAGASLSGDLKNPSRSIPRGTLGGLGVTFVIYSLVILTMGFTIAREAMVFDLSILQDVSFSPIIVIVGILATSIFSILVGILSAGKILQAMARDNLIPFFSPFAQGTKSADDPIIAMLASYGLVQVMLLYDNLNDIAAFVTMAHLLTFAVINLACFLLKIGSAPNFRPSFHFFRSWTALLGFLLSVIAMILVDSVYASISLLFVSVIFSLIHYLSPPKAWGDVSQSIIYHQVRKYLLRLDSRKDHVKFWRPQILLLVNDPRHKFALIQLCNALKKGSLYVLGHVIKGEFQKVLPELRKQQQAWLKFVDVSHIKAFVDIIVADNEALGARSLIMTCGLGGMKPNIVVMGSFNLRGYLQRSAATEEDDSRVNMDLPTDEDRVEEPISAVAYVTIIEDVLAVDKAIGIGFRMNNMEIPKPGRRLQKKYIDLWPIQMSAPQETESALGDSSNVTNFDTYTLILQLGTILSMVHDWQDAYTVRVMVFVEHSEDVEDERKKVQGLLDNLRIPAEVHVLWLGFGDVMSYETIVRGKGVDKHVEQILKNNLWWQEIKKARSKPGTSRAIASAVAQINDDVPFSTSLASAAAMRISIPHPTAYDTPPESDTESESEGEGNDDLFPRSYTWATPDTSQRLKKDGAKSYGTLGRRNSHGDDLSHDADGNRRHSSLQFIEPDRSSPRLRNASHASHTSHTSVIVDPPKLDFNALPLRAQLIICNDLMRLHSKDTALLFTSFPAPAAGSAQDEASALEFLADLDILASCSCPALLIHSKTLTVTMSL